VNAEETKQGVEAILEAGKATTSIAARVDTIDVEYRNTKIVVPVAAAGQGVVVLRDAFDLAKQAHADQSPERAGHYTMADLESLLAWAGRHRTPNTAAFLSAPTPSAPGVVQVTIDELPTGDAGCHRKLSASLALRFSNLLAEWLKLNGQWQSAEAFYSFIDEHTEELTTADVLTMAKNIEVRSESTFKRTIGDDGKVKLVLEDQSGPAMSVPRKLGFIAPMFSFGGEYKAHTFTARLALKLDKGRPMFRFEIVDLPGRVLDATRVIRDEIGKVVPLVYMGARG
jgi:uncharacterized protein YfdQ (DUF2303 family)